MLPIFTETQSAGLGIDRRLFARFVEGEEFKLWQNKNHTWQLRCIGGPGAGKTTLSTVVVSHLRKTLVGTTSDVAAIYFQRPVEEVKSTILAVLESVRTQLAPSSDTLHAHLTASEPVDLNTVREALSERLQQDRQAFLVLDDLDLCGLEVAAALEAELERLQDQGLSIFVTSRVPREYSLVEFRCDADPEDEFHTDTRVSLHWVCATCRDEDRVIEGDSIPVDICNVHVDGYICKRCVSATNMVEPYRYVDMLLTVAEDDMRHFIATELERGHGDLDLGSSFHPKPLRSKLGRSLMESHTPYSAQRLLDRIVDFADGNIAIAKLRLEDIEMARGVDDLLHLGDRLPDNIVALYNAGVNRIQQKPEPYRTIGLKALVGVASGTARPFFELQKWLRREAALTSPPSAGSPDYTIKDVIHAAAGFLSCDPWDELNPVMAYNQALQHYIGEDYNESLLWVRSEMQFGAPSRSSSMVFGPLKMPRGAAKPRFRIQPQGLGVTMAGAPHPINFKDHKKTKMTPRRQTSGPGRTKEEKQREAGQAMLKRSTTWL